MKHLTNSSEFESFSLTFQRIVQKDFKILKSRQENLLNHRKKD